VSTLSELIQTHLSSRGQTVRGLAESSGIGYATLLNLIKHGHVPRKPEHREALRRTLAVDHGRWASVLAASGSGAQAIPESGPLNLQQLVVRSLYALGFTEQTLARASGVAYATLIGITRKGSLPRLDSLEKLATALGLPQIEVDNAAEHSRAQRRGEPPQETTVPPVTESPSLAQLVANMVARRKTSIAAFAHEHHIPYLSLMRLIDTGVPPGRKAVLEQLGKALEIDEATFTASLARSRKQPQPALRSPGGTADDSPLQARLREFMRVKALTLKEFAAMAGLSVLTASRLVKHGTMPGRPATHDKLRVLLGMTTDDYDRLVSQSDTADLTPTSALSPTPSPEEFQHQETEEITYVGVGLNGLGEFGGLRDELVNVIGRLTLRQQQALHAFLVTLI